MTYRTAVVSAIALVIGGGSVLIYAQGGLAPARPTFSIKADARVGTGTTLSAAFDNARYELVSTTIRIKEEDAPITKDKPWMNCFTLDTGRNSLHPDHHQSSGWTNCGDTKPNIYLPPEGDVRGDNLKIGGLGQTDLPDGTTMVTVALVPRTGQHWRGRIELILRPR
jgi:hypothetical protein